MSATPKVEEAIMARRILLRLLLSIVALCLLAPTAAEAGTRYRGVQLHSLWAAGSNSDMVRELDLASRAGANVVRVDVGWSSLESGGKGQISAWYLQKLDRFVNAADVRGMKVIATLWSTPCWASTAPATKKQGCEGAWWDRGVTVYAPEDPADYADVARLVTTRYGTKLAALEVWNEPNLAGGRFWIAEDEPLEYTALLRAAYRAAKAGNPNVPVLAGALAYTNPLFLAGMYEAGAMGSYDGLSVHPYQGSRSLARGWSGMTWIRGIKAAAGDRTPIWVTEFGWSTCNSGHGACVSERRQGEYTAASFAALDEMDDVEAAVAYNLRAKGTDAGSFESNFGLVHRNYAPKPAYEALRRALGGRGRRSTGHRAGDGRGRGSTGHRVRLRLRRQRLGVVAYVRGPRRTQVRLRVSGCHRARSRSLWVRTNRRGRGLRRLGYTSRLSGCRVRASVPGGGAVATRVRMR